MPLIVFIKAITIALGAIADRIIIMAYEYGGTPEPAGKVVEAVEMAKSLVPIDKLILGINIPGKHQKVS